ncbi:hypothetical protein VTK56DRAFT_8572 [Thermocarpiscus australiensis]
MTTAAAQAPARIPTPRPKHSRTSSLQSDSAAASKSRPNQASASTDNGAPPQQAGGGRRGARTAAADPLSDKATAFLIRRVLCPQHPDKGKNSPASIEGLLPPLTSRNDVDLQLYALIAIILRECVQNWYNKITPDETFVAEIVQIIAHITRAIEQRLRKVDLESFLFDELPELLDKHVTAYRAAHDPTAQPPVRTDPREIYHSLCPLPALSPVPRPDEPESIAAQAENEAVYRQLLVQAVLAILLPTEDLGNGPLTALVGQILSELIIGNAVANRLSEPWLIWELLIIASRNLGRRGDAEDEKQASIASSEGRRTFSVQALFWMILQWCFLATSFIRMAFTVLMASWSLPPRIAQGVGPHKDAAQHHVAEQDLMRRTDSPSADPPSSKTPVLAFRCWSAISNLAEIDVRMPWLCGALSMLQWVAMMGPGRIAAVDGKLDRLLSYGIHRFVLDAANLPPLLRSVRGALFPNNTLAGKPTLVAPSSDAELRALRRRCASSLWALIPSKAGRLYFSGGSLRSLLFRASPASPDSRAPANATAEKTEGSVQLTAGDNERDAADSERDHDGETAAALAQPPQAPDRSSQSSGTTGSRARSRRSAPAPTPKTGGQQGTLVHAHAADPGPTTGTSSTSASGEAGVGSDGMASTGLTQGDGKDQDDHDRGGDHDEAADERILDEIERGILDVFGDAYCNKHLVYAVVELILVRLMPELAEKGVLELWAERLPVHDL